MSKIRLACSVLPQWAVLQTCYSRNISLGPTLYIVKHETWTRKWATCTEKYFWKSKRNHPILICKIYEYEYAKVRFLTIFSPLSFSQVIKNRRRQEEISWRNSEMENYAKIYNSSTPLSTGDLQTPLILVFFPEAESKETKFSRKWDCKIKHWIG